MKASRIGPFDRVVVSVLAAQLTGQLKFLPFKAAIMTPTFQACFLK
jgi:hypothetical protein